MWIYAPNVEKEMTKLLYKGHYPYCDKSDCLYWDKCSLAVTQSIKEKGEPVVKEHRACYVQNKKEDNEE